MFESSEWPYKNTSKTIIFSAKPLAFYQIIFDNFVGANSEWLLKIEILGIDNVANVHDAKYVPPLSIRKFIHFAKSNFFASTDPQWHNEDYYDYMFGSAWKQVGRNW